MFRIRRIYEDNLRNEVFLKPALSDLLKVSFPTMSRQDVENFFYAVYQTRRRQFRHFLFVAEHSTQGVIGLALCGLHEGHRFVYLDYILAKQNKGRGGVGGALYQRVRETAAFYQAKAVFLECKPDSAEFITDSTTLKQNRARIRFYEGLGARVVVNTDFEAVRADGTRWSLLYDPLGAEYSLSRTYARKVIGVILGTKNDDTCSPAYQRQVLRSCKDNPLQLRDLAKQGQSSLGIPKAKQPSADDSILLVENQKHQLHHVRDKGYFEVPIRVRELRRGLEQLHIFHHAKVKHFPDKHILAVHDKGFYEYLKYMAQQLESNRFIYAEVFPLREGVRPPKEILSRIGYYATDSFTPISRNAFEAARESVNCALTAAAEIRKGRRIAYALVRPPGHHAERKAFGGFCYLNSTAIAAQYLSEAKGRVAILDLDYHHGNGQQDIFYTRKDVLTISLHADPRYEYPHFSGYVDERGEGKGVGFNQNYPLPLSQDGAQYLVAVKKAIKRIREFDPRYVVIALGFDTAKGDPTGSWRLQKRDFRTLGGLLGAIQRPTLIVQEGGYRTRSLATNAKEFFYGFWNASE